MAIPVYFRWRPTIFALVLAAIMVRLAYWQWERHLEKEDYLARLARRLEAPVADFSELVSDIERDPDAFVNRRVRVTGTLEPDYEMVLRNRRLDQQPGVYLLTPLRVQSGGHEVHVVLQRGFVPLHLAEKPARAKFSSPKEVDVVALVKPSGVPRFMSPQDPLPKPGGAWIDAWLRVELSKMERQLPFPILPIYLERMPEADPSKAQHAIVKESRGEAEILFMGDRTKTVVASAENAPDLDYPVAAFETVAPPSRHLSYVYHWSFMAIGTLLMSFLVQLRPSRAQREARSRAH